MEPQEIKKIEKPLPFEATEGWTTVSPEAAGEICAALANPLRRKILELLDEGPLRQKELLNLLGEATGKKGGVKSLLHHLRILERAGLIGHVDTVKGGVRSKLIYRSKDVRIQTYLRPVQGE
ncbi:MAG: winged helix-turn-helix domain-containing protein [Candidatus Hadarchaeales archaeon]